MRQVTQWQWITCLISDVIWYPGEVGENPSPQGAVNATWDTLNMGFVDPAKLPADKNAPVVVF